MSAGEKCSPPSAWTFDCSTPCRLVCIPRPRQQIVHSLAGQHRATLENGRQPSLHVQTASERSREELKLGKGDVSIVEIAVGARPFGPRFGSLVHTVLATIPLDGAAEQVRASTQLYGRVLGASPEEIEATVTTVAAALHHPLMDRARKAARSGFCHREIPLTLRQEDGTLIEGIADLAFRDNDKWIVVDFKTDRELSGSLERYRRQVAIYAAAISRATSTRSEAFLFRL